MIKYLKLITVIVPSFTYNVLYSQAYQPLEDQRLSTTNNVHFANIIGNTLTATTPTFSGTINSTAPFFFNQTSTGTNAGYGQFNNNGRIFLFGKDNSDGTFFGTNVPYANVFYSNSNYTPYQFYFGSSKILDITYTGLVSTGSFTSGINTAGNAGYFYNNNATAGESFGLAVQGGTNVNDYSLLIQSSLGANRFKIDGTGAATFYSLPVAMGNLTAIDGHFNRSTNTGYVFFGSGNVASFGYDGNYLASNVGLSINGNSTFNGYNINSINNISGFTANFSGNVSGYDGHFSRTANTGYVYFGSNNTSTFGFDGNQLQANGPMVVNGTLIASTNTAGYAAKILNTNTQGGGLMITANYNAAASFVINSAANQPTTIIDGNGNETLSGSLYVPNGNISSTLYIGSVSAAQAGSNALAVNGSAIFNKATVKLYGSWPDYVFKKNYKLPTLNSLENFININHHLPDVPSNNDVEKDGIDIGSNQALLFKKVEELTLLLIGQNKTVNELKEKIKLLEKRIKKS